MNHHKTDEVADIRKYKLRMPYCWSEWDPPPKTVENDHAMVQWGFQLQVDKQVMMSQLDAVGVDKGQKITIVTSRERNMRKWRNATS